MTQPTLTEPQRALVAAFAEGFAEAIQSPFMMLRTEVRALNETYAELVSAVDRLTAVVALQAAGEQDPDEAPDIEMPLERFHNFDWAQIGAQVQVEDEFGPAVVSYRGKAYKRRSPDNAFNPAIWFSRAIGKTEDGRNQYVRLITFRPMSDDVQPMGRKAEKAIAAAPATIAAPQPQPAKQSTTPAGSHPASSSSAAQPAPAAQPMLPEEPDWPARSPEEEFESWPSASEGKPPMQPKQQPGGPRVSPAARADEQPSAASTTAKPAGAGGASQLGGPKVQAGRRQTTIAGGEVYSAFTKWGVDFGKRYPYYRVANTDRTDFYHIQVSVYTLGETEDHKDSRFAYIKDLDLLKEAIAAMEAHAAAKHSGAGPRAN